MKASAFALTAVLLAACHDDSAPVAPMIAASSAPLVTASAPPVSNEKTPESCAALVAGKPDFAGCTWTVEKHNCVCNGCTSDSDCSTKANGACTLLASSKGTMASAKVCLYPGDDCFGGTTCAKGRACNHNGMGRSGGCTAQGDSKPK